MDNPEIKALVEKYIAGEASPEEENRLTKWYRSVTKNEVEVEITNRHEPDEMKQRILKRLYEHIHNTKQPVIGKRNIWKPIAAAASVLTIASLAAYLWFKKSEITTIAETESTITSDIPPGTDKATLTLADGSMIELDNVATGNLAEQGNTKIIKLDSGQLAYTGNSYEPTIAVTQYNVLATPRGGKYAIALPDGSNVWLNAASSLKFPVAFTGNERLVELTGEGYFEIAKNAKQPFKVLAEGILIEALGTQFNINAYKDEAAQSTTLVEGAVRILQNQKTEMLKPGQQLIVADDGIMKVKNVNVESVIAWKEGYFEFENVPLELIMRQVARWYDVDIEYKGTIIKKLSLLRVPRNVTASNMFKILEQTGNIRFEIAGKKVVVIADDM